MFANSSTTAVASLLVKNYWRICEESLTLYAFLAFVQFSEDSFSSLSATTAVICFSTKTHTQVGGGGKNETPFFQQIEIDPSFGSSMAPPKVSSKSPYHKKNPLGAAKDKRSFKDLV